MLLPPLLSTAPSRRWRLRSEHPHRWPPAGGEGGTGRGICLIGCQCHPQTVTECYDSLPNIRKPAPQNRPKATWQKSLPSGVDGGCEDMSIDAGQSWIPGLVGPNGSKDLEAQRKGRTVSPPRGGHFS